MNLAPGQMDPITMHTGRSKNLHITSHWRLMRAGTRGYLLKGADC
jgi:hypothetical protein